MRPREEAIGAVFSPSDHTFAICAYKESPYLEECVSSLMAQTTRTNVIIATSTPNPSIDRVAQRHGLPVFASGAPSGICADWNHASSRATTPLVTIAHQDDTYEPTYAERMLEAMNRASHPLIFFCNYGELRDGRPVDDNRLLRVKRMLLRPMARRGVSGDARVKRGILSLGSSICCPSVTLYVPALPSPPFQSTMRSNLDWDTWERYSHLDGEFVYDSKVLMHHRIHGGSETSALIRDNTRTAEDLEMLGRFWPAPVARALNHIYALGQRSNG